MPILGNENIANEVKLFDEKGQKVINKMHFNSDWNDLDKVYLTIDNKTYLLSVKELYESLSLALNTASFFKGKHDHD